MSPPCVKERRDAQLCCTRVFTTIRCSLSSVTDAAITEQEKERRNEVFSLVPRKRLQCHHIGQNQKPFHSPAIFTQMPEDPPPTMGGVDHGGRSLPSTLRTPSEDEGEGGARTRPLPTPGKRARAEEEARAARRQRVVSHGILRSLPSLRDGRGCLHTIQERELARGGVTVAFCLLRIAPQPGGWCTTTANGGFWKDVVESFP